MKNSVSVTAEEYFKYFTPDPEAYEVYMKAQKTATEHAIAELEESMETMQDDMNEIKDLLVDITKLVEKLTNA
ncbi:MAG: hypothetical protein P8I94_03695 [Emcibacteraceae bacterium]|nr:hypothetical protein [Emcibacteraceae bacterium]